MSRSRKRPRQAVKAVVPLHNYRGDILCRNSLSSHFRQPHFHLSSLMNRCCSAVGVSLMDRVAGRHIILLRASERGHLDTEEHAGVPRLFCISHLLPIIVLTSRLTFKCFSAPEAPPPYSTLPPTVPSAPAPCQTFCSADYLPVMCPCPQLEETAGRKGQNIYNKVKTIVEKQRRSCRRSRRDLMDGQHIEKKKKFSGVEITA